MEHLLRQFVVCVVLTSRVFSQNNPPSFTPTRVVGGGGGGIGGAGFNCPEENGIFEAPGDCSRYYQCERRVATLAACPPSMIFNSQARYCDWPSRVPNSNCAGSVSHLNQDSTDVCRINPGDPNQAFISGHPQLCNAFYTCDTLFAFAPCTFCGEGMYFSVEARGCREYASLGVDINVLCQNRQFVQHSDKVTRQLDGSCWPFQTPNPFQAIIEGIRNGPSRPTPALPRPG